MEKPHHPESLPVEPLHSGNAEGYSELSVDDGETGAETISVNVGAASYAENKNEDVFSVDRSGNAVLCDGVGSSGYGLEAAELATRFLEERLEEMGSIDNRELAEKSLAGALETAHMRILAERRITGHDLVSTASIVKYIQENGQQYAVVGNYGDSPVYLMRNGQLTELTGYHDYLPPREKRPALGRQNGAKPNLLSVPMMEGDRLIVTSNGLRKNDPDMSKMQKILRKNEDPQEAAEKLARKVTGDSSDARTALVLELT
jgi:serine/threonine protein phosphatase PrpC